MHVPSHSTVLLTSNIVKFSIKTSDHRKRNIHNGAKAPIGWRSYRPVQRISNLALALTLVVSFESSAMAENWPQWRGPAGNGVSRERNLPLAWSERRGIAWKTETPGWGNSTPAIWKNAIFVTSQKDDQLLLSRLDRQGGKIVWTRTVGQGTTPRNGKGRGEQKFHNIHNLASPSPVTNGTQVVVHFGNGDLAAFDFEGKQLWKRNLQEDHGKYTIWWGHSNSPVLYNGSVISVLYAGCPGGSTGQAGGQLSCCTRCENRAAAVV